MRKNVYDDQLAAITLAAMQRLEELALEHGDPAEELDVDLSWDRWEDAAGGYDAAEDLGEALRDLEVA
jgi:hypothetical protein